MRVHDTEDKSGQNRREHLDQPRQLLQEGVGFCQVVTVHQVGDDSLPRGGDNRDHHGQNREDGIDHLQPVGEKQPTDHQAGQNLAGDEQGLAVQAVNQPAGQRTDDQRGHQPGQENAAAGSHTAPAAEHKHGQHGHHGDPVTDTAHGFSRTEDQKWFLGKDILHSISYT